MPSKLMATTDIFEEFENELRNACSTPNKMLSDDLAMILLSGGKRIRPRLALLCAKLGRFNLKQIVPLMVALELAHTASLMHDDAIDDAKIRRGIPTINAIRNNKLAVLAGDYLLGMIEEYAHKYVQKTLFDRIRQIITINKDENAFAVSNISRLICEMSVGEYMQQEVAFSVEKQTLERYLKQVELKTGVFMKYCCVAGGAAGNLKKREIQSLGQMGMALGMAFQITDDILDYEENEQIGKTIGQDFLCGIYNLPMIYAVTNSKNNKMLKLAERREKTDSDIEKLIRYVIDNNGINEAKKHRLIYIETALNELNSFPDGNSREELCKFVRNLAERTY